MQALAIGATKTAADRYDKVILKTPSLETTERVVEGYRTAGLKAAENCTDY